MNIALRVLLTAALFTSVTSARAAEPALVLIEEDSASAAPLIERGELPRGTLARGIFTARVENKEPIDDLAELPADAQRVYFFSELHKLNGQTVTHRWELNGTPMGDSRFNVGGWRWRVWSVKTLDGRAGTWTVKVLNSVGEVVGEKSINVGGAPTR